MDISGFENILGPKFHESSVPFHPGQIFYGKVLYLDRNGIAKIQFGHRQIYAKVDAPIDVSKDYWFQVDKHQDGIRLIIIHEKGGNMFGKSVSKEANVLLSALKDWNLTIDQGNFPMAEKWLKQTGDSLKTLEAIRWMILRNLPFTDQMFQTTVAMLKREPFSLLFDRLIKNLSNSHIEEKEKILQQLQSFFNTNGKNPFSETNWSKGTDVYRAIRFLLKAIGIDSSRSNLLPENKVPLIDLFSQLLQQKETLPKDVQKAFETLFFRVVGGQFVNKGQTPYLMITFSIPIPLEEQIVDATFQWEGKKKEDGQLDERFSRILFDLTMPRIGKTLIIMNVQNRIVSLYIKTEQKINKSNVTSHIQQLKENLEKKGYMLSTVQFEKLESNRSDKIESGPFFQTGKVDVKI